MYKKALGRHKKGRDEGSELLESILLQCYNICQK